MQSFSQQLSYCSIVVLMKQKRPFSQLTLPLLRLRHKQHMISSDLKIRGQLIHHRFVKYLKNPCSHCLKYYVFIPNLCFILSCRMLWIKEIQVDKILSRVHVWLICPCWAVRVLHSQQKMFDFCDYLLVNMWSTCQVTDLTKTKKFAWWYFQIMC